MPELETHFPWDGQDAFEGQWRAMAQHFRTSGVIRETGSEFVPSAVSGQVRAAPGKCWIQGHYGEATANKDHTPAAPHATLDRIDLLVLRADFNANRIETDLKTGVAAANPQPPNVTRDSTTWETRLAHVRVAATSGALTVTDMREWARGVGEPPVGTIIWGAWPVAPPGWLLCNGQAVSRITYFELAFAIGTTFGAGDGVSTFNVPDLRGRAAVGLDNMGGVADAGRLSVPNTLGGFGGTERHTLTVGELPAHSHGDGSLTAASAGAHSHGITGTSFIVGDQPTSTIYTNAGANVDHAPAWDLSATPSTSSAGAHTHDITGSTGSTGSGQPHDNMPPYLLLNAAIKV